MRSENLWLNKVTLADCGVSEWRPEAVETHCSQVCVNTVTEPYVEQLSNSVAEQQQPERYLQGRRSCVWTL